MMMWIRGPAGAGKSAIAQTLGERCKASGLLAATFFLSRTGSAERGDGDRVIPTLAQQLLRWFPEMKPHVLKAIGEDPFLFERSRGVQMQELLVNPLVTWTQSLNMPESSSLPLLTKSTL